MKKLLASAFLSLSIATSASAGDLGSILTGLGTQAISNLAAKALGVAPAPKASRQMDEEAWQNARAAEAMFQSLPTQADDSAIYDPKNATEARRLIAAYRKASAPIRAGPGFTEQQLEAYAQSLLPFLRYAQHGLPQTDTTLLPGQKKTFQAQTFCLDRGLPAPIPQDNLRLLPASALIPDNGKALYDALMSLSASRPDARFTVQNLVWGMRHAEQGYTPELSHETRNLLNGVLPEGAEQYQSFMADRQQSLRGAQQRQQMFRQFQGLVAESTGIHLPPPSATDGSFTAGDVAQAMVALNHAPAPPPDSVAEGSPYTQLATHVAARVSNAEGISSMQIEVVNASDQPFSFVATDYVGQTVRPTQRMAIAWINDAPLNAQYDWNWISPAHVAEKKLQAVTTALEIPALKQAQRNIQTWLDRQAEAGASKPMLGALALGTAVNEVLLPTTAIDLLPLGKVGKIAKAAVGVEKGLASEKALAASATSGLAGETVKNAGDVIKRPSGFRKSTIQDAWDNAAPGSVEGTKACPTCSKDVEVGPGNGRRDWDVDHQPKWNERDLKWMDRKEVLDEYNKDVRLRCPNCNRSDN